MRKNCNLLSLKGNFTIITLFFLFLILLMSVTCAKSKEKTSSETPSKEISNTDTSINKENKSSGVEKQTGKRVLNVYLFHGTYRCRSCNLMEEMTVEAIKENFSKEKEKGEIVFEHINVEEPQNNHFINYYKLSSISIIVSKNIDGKEKEWKNLNQVWMLLGDREKFKEYIVKEIKSYL